MALQNAINLVINAANPLSATNGGLGVSNPTANGILVANGASAASSLVLTDGQLLIGDTGGAPVAAAITAGAGITVTNGAGSITIAASGAEGYTEVTGTSAALAVNAGYIANNAALVTLTLPATAAIGDVFYIVGKGAGLWRVAQNAGQTIYYGDKVSTAGTGGYIEATHARDSLKIVCVTADDDFQVVSSVGNIDVV